MTDQRKGQQVSVAERARLSWESYQRCVREWGAIKPGRQVAAASGYLRAVMERAEPEMAERFATAAVTTLVAMAKELDAATAHRAGDDEQR